MKNIFKLLLIIIAITSVQSCMLTKVIAVPMRVTGAVVSIIPVVGDPMHDAIDVAADAID
ncbi:MAG TPA: hypothetical protein EYQ77_01185 [Methylococcaceae bacterium]|jgi:hypothetical protein|nr:hypothetical protein [Methylococcaceae bacterium]